MKNEEEFNSDGFNKDGINKETGTKYDVDEFDQYGSDRYGLYRNYEPVEDEYEDEYEDDYEYVFEENDPEGDELKRRNEELLKLEEQAREISTEEKKLGIGSLEDQGR